METASTTRTKPMHSRPDSDFDGLADGAEDRNLNGHLDPGETDPTEPDSDGDGLADGFEDRDRDGMEDADEFSPRRFDSDEDGLNDLIETLTGTDPTNPDTDGDGLADGVEDSNQNGVQDFGRATRHVKTRMETGCSMAWRTEMPMGVRIRGRPVPTM